MHWVHILILYSVSTTPCTLKCTAQLWSLPWLWFLTMENPPWTLEKYLLDRTLSNLSQYRIYPTKQWRWMVITSYTCLKLHFVSPIQIKVIVPVIPWFHFIKYSSSTVNVFYIKHCWSIPDVECTEDFTTRWYSYNTDIIHSRERRSGNVG